MCFLASSLFSRTTPVRAKLHDVQGDTEPGGGCEQGEMLSLKDTDWGNPGEGDGVTCRKWEEEAEEEEEVEN